MSRALLSALLLLAPGCSKDAAVSADAAPATKQPERKAAPLTGPQADECTAAIENMKRIAPHLVEGDAADREDCMRMPREVVACLKAVKSESAAEACVKDFAARHGEGGDAEPVVPEERATADECKQVDAHLRALGRKAADPTCARLWTKTDVACALAATTLAEAKACGSE